MFTKSKKRLSINDAHAAIEAKNLNVAFDGRTVIDDVSFTIAQGEIAVIIGPNGSGKTTLLKTIAGLIEPTRGSVSVFGKLPKYARGAIGYVPQRFIFDRTFPITVQEFLELSSHQHDSGYCDELLNHVDMASERHKQLASLSGGQLQRALIARALLRKPYVLFLDEPSSGIDVAGEESFYELVQHIHEVHEVTTVMVSHEIDIVHTFADQVLCINKKLLCHGPPQNVLTQDTFKELYGHEVGLYKHKC